MKKSLFLSLLLALQPLWADSYINIDGSIFPSSNLVTQTSSPDSDVSDPQKTYCWAAKDSDIEIDYDYDVAALYTDSAVGVYCKIYGESLTAEQGAIYLRYAQFLSECVLKTTQTEESVTYGTPQIIIEDSVISSQIELDTASATLRDNTLSKSVSVSGSLTLQGVYTLDDISLTTGKGIYLDTTNSYTYYSSKILTLNSGGTITIGEEGSVGDPTHTLNKVSSLAVNYTGNGGDDENFDVVNNDIVTGNVTITAANGRVSAGILQDSGDSVITAKLLNLSAFTGESLKTETSGATWITGDLVAKGSLSLSGSTLRLEGENNTAGNDLTLKASGTLIGNNENATFCGNSISLTGKSIDMSGSFSGGTLQATATNENITLVTLGKTGSLIGATTLTSKTGDITVDSFVGSDALTATAGGTLTLGSATAAGTINLTAADINVSKSVISTASSGTSTIKATNGAITISGALTAADTAELTATSGIRIIGNVSAGTATFTPGSGMSVSIGDFSGNLLTITQAGAVTIGKFLSTETSTTGADTALITCSSLHATSSVGRKTRTYGIFRATTSSGSMTFDGAVSVYLPVLTSAADITFKSTLAPTAQAILKASNSISVSGAADLKQDSVLCAQSMTFSSGLTATGLTLNRNADLTGKTSVSLGGDLVLASSAAVHADVTANGHNVTITDSTVDGSVSGAADATLKNSTLDSLSVSGALISEGSVTISNQTAGLTTTSLTLKGGELTLGNHNVNLTTSVLNIEEKSTLNANLVLLSNAEVTLAEGTSINLGCSLTLTDSTSFTLSEQLTPGTAITLMSGVDELITNGSAWTTDGDTVSTTLAEVKNEDGTYTYTTGAKSGSLTMAYDKSSGEGGTIVMTPEPATATLSLLALAALASRRRRE